MLKLAALRQFNTNNILIYKNKHEALSGFNTKYPQWHEVIKQEELFRRV